jgi:hypothetical protein
MILTADSSVTQRVQSLLRHVLATRSECHSKLPSRPSRKGLSVPNPAFNQQDSDWISVFPLPSSSIPLPSSSQASTTFATPDTEVSSNKPTSRLYGSTFLSRFPATLARTSFRSAVKSTKRTVSFVRTSSTDPKIQPIRPWSIYHGRGSKPTSKVKDSSGPSRYLMNSFYQQCRGLLSEHSPKPPYEENHWVKDGPPRTALEKFAQEVYMKTTSFDAGKSLFSRVSENPQLLTLHSCT